MSSRREQKDRLRDERLAAERSAAESARRRRLFQIGLGGAAAAVVAVVVIVLALSAGGGGTSAAEAGVQETAAPWQPEYGSLQKRVAALGLPQVAEFPFHQHALLRVYVEGKRVTVPANIGIDAASNFITSLHTHDTTGVVHMEAVREYPFQLGQFFDVWGVKFSADQIGAYRSGAGRVVQAYVNGKRVADPVHYVMQAHDRIVVGYGKPGSFPTRFSTPFPAGL